MAHQVRSINNVILVILLMIALTSSTALILAAPIIENGNSILESLNITVQTGEFYGDVKNIEVTLPTFTLIKNDDYITLKCDDKEIYYTSQPGKPILPYKYIILTFNGKIEVNGIKALNVKFIEQQVKGIIEPASKPIPYIIGANITQYSKVSLDKSVYSKDTYYPGKLFSYYVGYGLGGKTYVIIWIYPIQYNPARNKIIEIISMTLRIYYTKSKTTLTNASGEGNALILTTEDLIDVGLEYKNAITELTGFNATIVTVEWIYTHVAPAENITMYPGFYTYKSKPIFKIGEIKDPYKDLVKYYNWTLALKIINYLRNETAHPELRYILVLGSARTVPPSFYYLSYENYGFMPYQGWVPTDFFYASPDYDLLPNYYVGRIPFDDPSLLLAVLNKIKNWYNVTAEDPLWVKKVALFGGFPFLTSMLFGESALGKIVNEGYLASFSVSLNVRTDGSYTAKSAAKVFEEGEYAWAYYLLHGSGNAMVDYNIINNKFTIEYIMDSYRLLGMKPNVKLPIVTSVACSNAAWDTKLLNPMDYGMFMPPSFGEAILMSPAGGIAYVGFSRIAWEAGIRFIFTNGVYKPEFYGAAWLLSLVYKAYTDLSKVKNFTTLGEVVSQALVEYLATAGAKLRGWEQSIMMLTIMEFSLLGDPSLKMPLFKPPKELENIRKVEVKNYRQLVSALIIYASSRSVVGEVPYFKAPVDTIGVDINALTDKVRAYIIRIKQPRAMGFLMGFKVVEVKDLSVANGMATLTSKTSRDVSGYVLIRLKTAMGDARVYLISYGLTAMPLEVGAGEPVYIEGYGLNVVFYTGTPIALEYAGRFLTLVFIDETGYFNKTVALPQIAPGKYKLTAYAFGTYGWMPIGVTLPEMPSVEIATKAVGALEINLAYAFEYKPKEAANVTIITLYKGKPVDAYVNVKLITPSGKEIALSVVKCGIGKYKTVFLVPEEEGSYLLQVTAKYVSELLSVYGSKIASFTVRKDIAPYIVESVGKKLSETEENIKSYIKGEIVKLSGDLEKGFALIKTEYGEVKEKLSNIIESIEIVNGSLVKINTRLGIITGEITEIKGGIVKIKTDLGTISVNIASLGETLTASTTKVLNSVKEVMNEVLGSKKTLDELNKKVTTMTSNLDLLSKVILGILGLSVASVAGVGLMIMRGRKG